MHDRRSGPGRNPFFIRSSFQSKPKTTRDPESLTWRDTQEIAHSGRVQLQPVRSPIDLSDLSDAELAAVKKLGLNNLQKQLAKGDPDTNQNENG